MSGALALGAGGLAAEGGVAALEVLSGPVGWAILAGTVIVGGIVLYNAHQQSQEKLADAASAEPCTSCAAEPGTEQSATEKAASDSPANATKKPNPGASKPYRENPEQLKGKPPADVEKELDKTLVEEGHWTKSPAKDGNGVRYLDGKGGLVIINKGYSEGLQSGAGDAVHQGPYVKIQPGGIRVPLGGNPATGG